MSELEIRQQQFATSFGLTLDEYKRLASATNHEELVVCLELLKAKKFRSAFRASCAQHVRQWLAGAPALKPLTPNQFSAATPKWPITYKIPV